METGPKGGEKKEGGVRYAKGLAKFVAEIACPDTKFK